jgi:hypothetical protein
MRDYPALQRVASLKRKSSAPHSARRRRLARTFFTALLIITVLLFFGCVPLSGADKNALVNPPRLGIVTQILDALVIYMSCREKAAFPVWKSPLPTFNLSCNRKTNSIDCHEAVPILTFLIDHYNRPLARKYIFIHAHERSWHYRRPVFDQIRELIATDYFAQNSYGGVFRVHCRGKGKLMTEAMYRYIYGNTSMPLDPSPANSSRPCCGTFFIDSTLVQMRPKKEYRTIRARLREWSREYHRRGLRDPGFYCSRTMEYTWHTLLANRTSIPMLPGEGV